MKQTKSNILKSALKLFNEKGFVNVRLQHIADEAFISVGNLAYHFENKQEILLALYNELVQYQENQLKELNIVPLFEHLDRHWDNSFKIQEAYKFFYIDTLEIHRSNQDIAEKHRSHIHWQTQQLSHVLGFNVSRGALEYIEQADLNRLARVLWTFENTWYHQSLVIHSSLVDCSEAKEHLWLLLKPYFSDIGLQEYHQLQQLKNTLSSFE